MLALGKKFQINHSECPRGPFPKILRAQPSVEQRLSKFNLSDNLSPLKSRLIANSFKNYARSFSDYNYVRNARNAYKPLVEATKWYIRAGELKKADELLASILNIIQITKHATPPVGYKPGLFSDLLFELKIAVDNSKPTNGVAKNNITQTQPQEI